MNVKNLVLGIGIFIVYLLMLNYGIEAFYASPKYEEFCKPGLNERYPVKTMGGFESTNCTFSQELQDKVNTCFQSEGSPIYQYDEKGCTIDVKECNFCNKKFNEAQKQHAKIVFFIALMSGIITLLIGFLVLSTEPVGSALMASGVGAIFYGSVRNWQNLSDIWRFLLLLLSLILIIWIALRLNRKENKFWHMRKK